MKKLLALLLAFCLTFCGGTSAFADVASTVAVASTGTFQIDNTSIAIKIGESAVLTAYENGSPTMNATWTVSNPSIATVSNGLVTGHQLGTTAVTATNSAGESVTCYVHVILKGIDVSSWQGNIDWGTVKNQGIDFAIIRTGYGKTAPEVQTDAYFEQNYSGATANGIKVGAYHYSYAENVQDALQEADFCLSILNGRKLDYPVFYDIEDTIHRTMDADLMADIVEAFCGKMEAAGYRTGVYSSVNIFNSNLSSPRLDKYDRWVASWGKDVPNFNKAYTIWQYAYGTLSGVNGNVDLNYSFKDYSQAGTPVNPSTPSTPTLTCDTSSYTFGSNDVYYYKVFTSSATQPTATSSNPSVVSVTFGKKVSDGYIFQINNVGTGTAVITTTTVDGASVSFQATGNKSIVSKPPLACDTTSPYTFGSNSTYYYKVFTNSATRPTATSSNPSVVSVTFGKKVSDGYIFQINNVGTGTAVITTTAADGSSVSFQATGTKSTSTSSPLKCDTTAPYTFGSNSSYYYKVFTTSATQPTATSSNPSAVSVTFGKKVSDGYIFQINNVGTGTAVITTTTADGSSVSFQATGTKASSGTAPSSGSLVCDTTYPFTIKRGNVYTFLFTPKGTVGTPQFTTGNSNVLITAGLKLRNGSYLLTVKGVGTGSTGVYATIPGQAPINYCTVNVQ
ncbi:MAG: Ig-like domain-containing protein [Clostridiales bacterium]|nr:Ig-like domain-containing protein [Clostridiales bacterium]